MPGWLWWPRVRGWCGPGTGLSLWLREASCLAPWPCRPRRSSVPARGGGGPRTMRPDGYRPLGRVHAPPPAGSDAGPGWCRAVGRTHVRVGPGGPWLRGRPWSLRIRDAVRSRVCAGGVPAPTRSVSPAASPGLRGHHQGDHGEDAAERQASQRALPAPVPAAGGPSAPGGGGRSAGHPGRGGGRPRGRRSRAPLPAPQEPAARRSRGQHTRGLGRPTPPGRTGGRDITAVPSGLWRPCLRPGGPREGAQGQALGGLRKVTRGTLPCPHVAVGRGREAVSRLRGH